MKITAKDNALTIAVDGKLRSHFVDPERHYAKGGLALQPPGDGKLVEFRNLELPEIDQAK